VLYMMHLGWGTPSWPHYHRLTWCSLSEFSPPWQATSPKALPSAEKWNSKKQRRHLTSPSCSRTQIQTLFIFFSWLRHVNLFSHPSYFILFSGHCTFQCKSTRGGDVAHPRTSYNLSQCWYSCLSRCGSEYNAPNGVQLLTPIFPDFA
jgi:hypothetical protein